MPAGARSCLAGFQAGEDGEVSGEALGLLFLGVVVIMLVIHALQDWPK